MEEVFQRFPHIGEKIMDQVNNADLTDCRMVNAFWKSCIDRQKLLWKRKIYRWLNSQKWQNVYKVLNVDMVKILANSVHQFYMDGGDGSELYKTPLEIAAIMGNTEIVAKLFKKEAFENQGSTENEHGLPFHGAAEYGRFDVCQFFIENLEDKNPKNMHDQTPLHSAASKGHFRICRMILEKIDDKNPKDSDDVGGFTPLHDAAESNHLAICRLIMKSVSDKNPTDANGRTPLHYASQNGHLAVCLHSYFH